jgi:outer membrane protein
MAVLIARLLSIVALLTWTTIGFGSDIKVGFVDIPFLIDEAPQSKQASARLEQEFAPRQQDIKTQKALLSELREKLEDEDLDLIERANIERELRKTERRVKRDEQEFREELNIQKNLEFKKVRVYVLDAIATFAKRYEYDLIISDGVLFANKKIDVTDEVLTELTQALQADGSNLSGSTRENNE